MMSLLAKRVSSWLKNHCGVTVPEDWLEACINWIHEENGGNLSEQAVQDMVFEQWLVSDLAEIGANCLPPCLAQADKLMLEGTFSLQMNSVLDVSVPVYTQLQKLKGTENANTLVSATQPTQPPWEAKPSRMLMLQLTDGEQEVQGMEYKPIRDLNTNLTPGCKMVVKGPVLCRKGVMMLTANNLRVLGGESDAQIEENTQEKVLARKINVDLAHSTQFNMNNNRVQHQQNNNTRDTEQISMQSQPPNNNAQPMNTQVQSRNTQVQQRNTQVQPRNTQVQPGNTQVQQRNTQVQQRNTKVQQRNTQVQPGNTQVQPGNTQVQQRNTQVQQRNTQVQPGNTQVEQRNTQVQQRNTQVQQRNTQVQPGNKQVQQRNTQIQQRNTQVQPGNIQKQIRNSVNTRDIDEMEIPDDEFLDNLDADQFMDDQWDDDIDDELLLQQPDTLPVNNTANHSLAKAQPAVTKSSVQQSSRKPTNQITSNPLVVNINVYQNQESVKMKSNIKNDSMIPKQEVKELPSLLDRVKSNVTGSAALKQTLPSKMKTSHSSTLQRREIFQAPQIKSRDTFNIGSGAHSHSALGIKTEASEHDKITAPNIKIENPVRIKSELETATTLQTSNKQYINYSTIMERGLISNLRDKYLDIGGATSQPREPAAKKARKLQDLDAAPYVYLSYIHQTLSHQAQTLNTTVRVKAYIGTLLGKLESNGGSHWSLEAKLNDGSQTMDVVLGNDVLEGMIGFPASESEPLKLQAKTDPASKTRMLKGLKGCQQKLVDLCCIMDLRLSPGQKPCVERCYELNEKHIEELFNRNPAWRGALN
ncbi:unnamed protein product [Owenia fusiformis]|uniref:RecQ-mediated genome instability protein 1 n=1 Tax=Owenia fusiformis TaxID=6347 RepID=A0A8J1TCJ1_OWEFU|nr:unnamed protein product [Owenia fusiformis]